MSFPHCDARILHEPGECDYCDRHPTEQELRMSWGIAFTGKLPTDGQLPCPADFNRGDNHMNWAGNVARRKGQVVIPVPEDSEISEAARVITDILSDE